MRTLIRELSEQKVYEDGRRRRLAEYQCECGKIDIIAKEANKVNTSCKTCAIAKGVITSTKVFSKHPLYSKWRDMKNRCNNPKVDRYNVYGARGIKVCKEWSDSYLPFYNFCMRNNWNKELSIDRIDVNGDYCPENCRLIPIKHQKYNLQNTTYVEFDNKYYPLVQIFDELGLKKERHTTATGIKYHKIHFGYYVEKYEIEEKIRDLVKRGVLYEKP